MLSPRIGKVVVNISVGKGGNELRAAEKVVENLTGRKPVRTRAKQTVGVFGIKQGEPIGCMVTLRGEQAKEFLEKALTVKENKIKRRSIDEQGNFSFGIKEHTNFPGIEYDPEIGIHGLDVSVKMKRLGYRVNERQLKKSKVGKEHLLDAEDTVHFLEDKFGVEVVEDE